MCICVLSMLFAWLVENASLGLLVLVQRPRAVEGRSARSFAFVVLTESIAHNWIDRDIVSVFLSHLVERL